MKRTDTVSEDSVGNSELVACAECLTITGGGSPIFKNKKGNGERICSECHNDHIEITIGRIENQMTRLKEQTRTLRDMMKDGPSNPN